MGFYCDDLLNDPNWNYNLRDAEWYREEEERKRSFEKIRKEKIKEYDYCKYILQCLEYGNNFSVVDDMHKEVIKNAIKLYISKELSYYIDD